MLARLHASEERGGVAEAGKGPRCGTAYAPQITDTRASRSTAIHESGFPRSDLLRPFELRLP
ncbi:hypothetical protein BC826DRAFT_989463 [Russula brevipes]|nr:hypothetical protein BC826DRAFT_989463 [Russula brevipes]